MNVLFVSNDPQIFDPTSSARARMRAYAAEMPHEELHIISRGLRASKDEQDGNLFLHPSRTSRLLILWRMPARVRALILKHGIDIVAAQDPFEYGLISLRAIAGTRAKLYVQLHTDFLSPWFIQGGSLRSPRIRMPLLNKMRRRFADMVLPKADGIRVVSERIKDSLTMRYGARIKEPVVIPVTVSTGAPLPVALPPHNFRFVFMAVGRVEPEKRLEDVVDALARIRNQYPQAGLMIVGDGREKAKIAKYARKWGLEDRVLFLGARPDAWGLLRNANAFIQASAYEGYGRTLIEAALARVPIITTDIGIVGEVFKGYRDVLSVPVADPAALAVAMVGVIEDGQARELMTRSAEAVAKQHLEEFKDQPKLIIADLSRLVA